MASSAFFPASPAPESNNTLIEPPGSLDVRGVAAKTGTPPAAVRAGRTRTHAVAKVNGGKAAVADGEDEGVRSSAPAPRTFYNQLPDWSMLLAAITTIFLAAERQWTLLDWKPKRPDMLTDTFGFGRIMHGGLVFRQDFSIRSYGADSTASIETLMNYLQEMALNHVKSDGFDSTPKMSKRNLFWVVSQMQVLVEQYPFCEWVMINKHTRKLSRIPDEVRTEIEPYFFERTAIPDEDNRKLPKLPVHGGATAMKYPRWADLDINQHVNNVKYIGWILESAPISIFENHELSSIVLDYKREYGRDCVLQSHTTAFTDCTDRPGETTLQCEHLLNLESGPTIVKARTMWRPKSPRTTQKRVTLPSVASA